MNTVQLVGRLATDPEIREIWNDNKVCNFLLAVDRNSEETDFFRIKAWNSQAEAAAKYLSKGQRVAVEGSLRQDTYEKDGVEHHAVSVIARKIEYL